MPWNKTLTNHTVPENMCDSEEDSETEKAWKTFAYCLIAFGSLVGNSLVILIIFRNCDMRSTINYFIVNMASSDFLFTVFVIPRLIAELYLGPETWLVGGTLGSILCKLDHFIQDISTAVSILSLVAIAFDRLYGVFFPMKAGLIDGRRICIIVLTGTWFLASVLHLHYFFAFKLKDRSEHLLCKYSWSAESAQVTFIIYSVCLFFFPGAVLVIVYTTIITRLWNTKIPGNHAERHKQRIAKRNRNVLRMVVAVVTVFICCWLPVNVSIYFVLFEWDHPPCYAKTLFFWIIFLAYSNGCITPFLYFIFNENFRKGFRRIFCCPCEIRGSLPSKSFSATRRSRTDTLNLKNLNDGLRKNSPNPRIARN
ncbi:QRFP-like peptide receptor [Acropora millepora]|uniref:QRFP-like peptide receptor n=1 Tax=Acropora millepora TaxID=45264 RepID=UPI001CF5F632|nr:QRFP-like peptide receptor [Acropora millepora]